MRQELWESGEDLEGDEQEESMIRIHCMKNCFQLNKKVNTCISTYIKHK